MSAAPRSPGLHAFIVGVGGYPHLAPADAADLPITLPTLGLRQLGTAATAAYRVARWIERRRNQPAAPFASARVLLSPSPLERQAHPGRWGRFRPATLDNFLEEADSWRRDAAGHPGNVALFYFAGHGVRRGLSRVSDDLLLLHDFGDGKGPVFRQAVSKNNLLQGMAQSEEFEGIAQKQLYALDACRNVPPEFVGLNTTTPSDPFQATRIFDDVTPIVPKNFSYSVYHGTEIGHAAYTYRERWTTVFGRAFLTCLEWGAARTKVGGGAESWNVTFDSLREALARHLAVIKKKANSDQTIPHEGLLGTDEVVIHKRGRPPILAVDLLVRPGAAKPFLGVSVSGLRMARPWIGEPGPQPPAWRTRLAAGTYRISGQLTATNQFSKVEEADLQVDPLWPGRHAEIFVTPAPAPPSP